MADYRIESDSMGEVQIPADAYWGAQTQRAVHNFEISPLRIPKSMLKALAVIKVSAAKTNYSLDLLTEEVGDAIVAAGTEVENGEHDDQFPLDVFQTGSGTSWNMNINEVIAGRANEFLGGQKGSRTPVHPNDHVNRGQSSNDVIPTSINIACRLEARKLEEALKNLLAALKEKEATFKDVIKLGRTHLQDAVPMTLGDEFSAWACQIEKAILRLSSTYANLNELAIGGTAIGTGLNAHPEFAAKTVANINEMTGASFTEAKNKFESISARDSQIELMGTLNTIAVGLMKIAQDLRVLSSGPRAGLGEIYLPSLQPGSSIMPGKINPVIPEMMIQVCAHIMGKHLSVTIGCQNSPLELNIMMPLIAYETLSALDILTNAVTSLRTKCIEGIKADEKRCRDWIDWSLALVTPLALKIGYDKAAKVAYKAYSENKKVSDLVVEEGILSKEEADQVLAPEKMLGNR